MRELVYIMLKCASKQFGKTKNNVLMQNKRTFVSGLMCSTMKWYQLRVLRKVVLAGNNENGKSD